jgi:single-stranded-DNA-specific exonuclease
MFLSIQGLKFFVCFVIPFLMRWQEPVKVDVPEDLLAFVGGHPMVAERLVKLGMTDIASARSFLDSSEYKTSSPFELPDVEGAVDRLDRAIRSSEPVLIWGDFDVDGQTATALLYSGLKKLGANVQYHVPLRHGEGHGIYLPRLRDWLSRGIGLMITCDTGITAHESVDVAQGSGVDVIITDHHLLEETLPRAHSVINPMRLPDGHKLRDLPGVGVAYQLIAALTSSASSAQGTDDLLDLVALGIVADVAKQTNETRYLLQRGIEMMRVTSRPGLRALLEMAEIDPLELDETDIGFGLAPRLNAQGRLSDAKDCVELLTTTDAARAQELAGQLESLNARRKLESKMIEDSAEYMLERDPSLLEYAVIVLSYPGWSGGVAGIVANRLAETWHKPVVLLCEEGDQAFGSARSVHGVNITQALHECRDLLLKFGGHSQAAGMTLRRDDIFDFRRRVSQAVRAQAPDLAEEPTLDIDGYICLPDVSLDFAADLRRLAPFGNGNPPLTLATRDLRLVRSRGLGRRRDHLELLVEDRAGNRQKVFWWNAGNAELPESRFDLACTLRISRYKGRIEPILELVDLRPIASEEIEVDSAPAQFVIEDHRGHHDPRSKLAEMLELYHDAIVWREGGAGIEGLSRNELKPAGTLIIWTPPPGPEEWSAALEIVKPRRLVLLDGDPVETSLESFLQRLGGLIKFVIGSRLGRTTLDQLAAATAQRTGAVRYGLMLYGHSGRLSVNLREDGSVMIEKGPTSRSLPDRESLERLLRNVIDETVAYRRNWKPQQ